MHKTLGDTLLALPFACDIFLLETHVAGMCYYAADEAIPPLAVGAPLHLRCEPGNPHDELAIEIFTANGDKLGLCAASPQSGAGALDGRRQGADRRGCDHSSSARKWKIPVLAR